MGAQILAVYGLRADILNASGHADAPPQPTREAAVLTTGVVALWCCRGHGAAARARLSTPRSRPHRRSRRRVHRRRPRLPALVVRLVALCGCTWKPRNPASVSSLESFLVVVCDHARIPRATFYQHAAQRGCLARTTRDCSGRKGPLRVTIDGPPVACCLTPGSQSNGRLRHTCRFDGPQGRHVEADKA
jgi:hypothetical protein